MKLPVFNKVHLVLPCCPISGIFCRHRLYLRLAASRAQASVKTPSMQKTQTEATLPISNEAYELCGTPGAGKVFKGLKRSMINYPLKNWIKKAGITKPITFHGFRHSYAVIQISLGTDIYTVSKMLTHKNVTTTQIYADLVNSKKRETANKISLK